MGCTVKAYRTYDEEEILQVISDPAIVKTISEDNGSLAVDPMRSCYIACRVDDELAAVWIFDKVGAVEIDVHAHVLPNHRPHSKDIGNSIFKEIIECAPWAKKFTAQIPFKYPNVYKYAKQFGFQDEGVNRQSYQSGGELFDQWRIGALLEELKHELD